MVVGDAGLGRDLPRRYVEIERGLVRALHGVCQGVVHVRVRGLGNDIADVDVGRRVLRDAARQRGVGELRVVVAGRAGAAGAGIGPAAVALVVDGAHLHLVVGARRQAGDFRARPRLVLRARGPVLDANNPELQVVVRNLGLAVIVRRGPAHVQARGLARNRSHHRRVGRVGPFNYVNEADCHIDGVRAAVAVVGLDRHRV